MRVYTVHQSPRDQSGSGGPRLDQVTFVKEGFCWPALFVPFFWLLWHRMWWVVLGWLAVGVGLSALGNLISGAETIVGVVSILFALWFALEANAFRRWSLGRKGWRMLGVAAGRDREEAEQSFFRTHLAPAGADPRVAKRSRVAPSATSAHIPRVPNTPSTSANEPAFGLFPRPE